MVRERSRPSIERAASTSSSSASSCINVAQTRRTRDISPSSASQSQSASASTPPTSLPEDSPPTEKQKGKDLYDTLAALTGQDETSSLTRQSTRPRRSRVSYNVNEIENKPLARAATAEGTRTFSGETLVGSETNVSVAGGQDIDTPRRKTLGDGIEKLDLDWKLDGMPGDSKGASAASPARRSKRRQSGNLLKEVAGVVGKAKSVLGKRGREVVESAKEMVGMGDKDKSSRRQSTRIVSLEQQKTKEESEAVEPPKKRSRLSFSLESIGIATTTGASISKPKTRPFKRYQEAGLYVGQDISASKSKSKKSRTSTSSSTTANPRTMLPLPMWGRLDKDRDFFLPWDVFAPTPELRGKDKPKNWSDVRKNRWVGDAKKSWARPEKLAHSTCLCKPPAPGSTEMGCTDDGRCLNREMLFECDDNNCMLGDLCSNRPFAELARRAQPLPRNKAGDEDTKAAKMNPYNFGVEVLKTSDRGFGVRATRSFRPGQIIVEYCGEVITNEECERRMREEYVDNECYYLMDFENGTVIDATKGSIARFVNHSCEPNCRVEKWKVNNLPRMALFAGDRGIMTGEELTYDYNFDPFSSTNVQECRCGTPSCRGFLGPKPKEERKPTVLAGLKRKLGLSNTTPETQPEQRKVLKKRKVPTLPRGWAYVDPKVEAQRLVEETAAKGLSDEAEMQTEVQENEKGGKRRASAIRKSSATSVRTVKQTQPQTQTQKRNSIIRTTSTKVSPASSKLAKRVSTGSASAQKEKGAEKEAKTLLKRAADGLSRTASVLSRASSQQSHKGKGRKEAEADDGKVKARRPIIVLKQSRLTFSPAPRAFSSGSAAEPLIAGEGKVKRAGGAKEKEKAKSASLGSRLGGVAEKRSSVRVVAEDEI